MGIGNSEHATLPTLTHCHFVPTGWSLCLLDETMKKRRQENEKIAPTRSALLKGTAGKSAATIEPRKAVEVLSLLCSSGFTKIDELQLVSLLHCNACREANVSWMLRVDDKTPERLLRLIEADGGRRASNEPGAAGSGFGRVYLPLSIQHLRLVTHPSGWLAGWLSLCL